MSHKVANFPGITVDVGVGAMQALPDRQLVDFPGTYSLQAISAEEQVAVEQFERALDDPEVEQVLCVIDATRSGKKPLFHAASDPRLPAQRQAGHGVGEYDRCTGSHDLPFDTAALRRLWVRRCWPSPRAPAKVLTRSGGATAACQVAIRQCPNSPVLPDELLRGEAHQLARRFGPKGDILIKSQTRLDSFFLHSVTGWRVLLFHYVLVVPVYFYLVRTGHGCGGITAGCLWRVLWCR